MDLLLFALLISASVIYFQQVKLAGKKTSQQFLSPSCVCIFIRKMFRPELLFLCVWEHEPPLAVKSESPNVSQLSVLTSFQLSWFHARSHYRPDKTVTLSNICLLIIHSAGGQMAPGSYSLAPALINQFLQQLWVIADALKFNSLLYEVRRSPHYVKESNRWANCPFFF